MTPPSPPICACGRPATLLRRSYGFVYACLPCDTRVGCHPGTTVPLGTLATATTRQLRIQAHAVFDALWKAKQDRAGLSKTKARRLAYAWLAAQLQRSVETTHIAQLSPDELQRVIGLCTPYATRLQAQAGKDTRGGTPEGSTQPSKNRARTD